uniref:Uncharacterized protein n=1 Tax=Octopus bimaculoides TaxID=37653 RepID=A0A0L8IFH4_OCTBM
MKSKYNFFCIVSLSTQKKSKQMELFQKSLCGCCYCDPKCYSAVKTEVSS